MTGLGRSQALNSSGVGEFPTNSDLCTNAHRVGRISQLGLSSGSDAENRHNQDDDRDLD